MSQANAERRLQEAWAGLAEAEQTAIRQRVLEKLGGTGAPAAFVQRLCLEELGRRLGPTVPA
jgi:hypothetical protein